MGGWLRPIVSQPRTDGSTSGFLTLKTVNTWGQSLLRQVSTAVPDDRSID
jgi:hypothetical protein